jgi:hypothetical protein
MTRPTHVPLAVATGSPWEPDGCKDEDGRTGLFRSRSPDDCRPIAMTCGLGGLAIIDCDNCAPHNSGSAALPSGKEEEAGMVQDHTVRPKWGQRRTRHDPPDVDDAVAAAQGLTDDIDSQVEIAAQLIGLSEEEVRPAVSKASARPRLFREATTSTRSMPGRTITVERRSPRVPSAGAVHRHR